MNLHPIHSSAGLDDLINRALLNPVQDLFSRPHKSFRSQLVRLGFDLVREEMHATEQIQMDGMIEMIEWLHAGSLIVDDIEDGSSERRGAPALHLRYGMPIALNAANWLYFQALQKISSLGLSDAQELILYRECHRTLVEGHYGQALDLGIDLLLESQDRLPDICHSTTDLKTGSLVKLAVKAGGLVGGATAEEILRLESFGREFGIILQRLDDFGNSRSQKRCPKHLEDFRNRRPSFIWCVAAQNLDAAAYQNFLNLVRGLPDQSTALIDFLESQNIFNIAKDLISAQIADLLQNLEINFPHKAQAIVQIHSLCHRLENSYV